MTLARQVFCLFRYHSTQITHTAVLEDESGSEQTESATGHRQEHASTNLGVDRGTPSYPFLLRRKGTNHRASRLRHPERTSTPARLSICWQEQQRAFACMALGRHRWNERNRSSRDYISRKPACSIWSASSLGSDFHPRRRAEELNVKAPPSCKQRGKAGATGCPDNRRIQFPIRKRGSHVTARAEVADLQCHDAVGTEAIFRLSKKSIQRA